MADITCVRLTEAFVYLAVVLDAFSRRVVGWALDNHIEARLAIKALTVAIAARDPPRKALIHHSDRDVQYACGDYTKLLQAEEVEGKTCRSLNDARRNIGGFLEDTYNRVRLHSALGYKPPVEFKEQSGHIQAI